VRKYHFPLQTALELRCREEEQARRRLATAQSVVRGRRADLEQMRLRHDAIIAGLRGPGTGGGASVALGEVEHTACVLADLRRRLTNQQQRLDEAERQAETRRTELVEASRARRTLERLSERREAEHAREEMLREQRDLNEAAISRHRADRHAALVGSPAADPDSV
jgi:flagellar export protein FliJ